MGKTLCISDLDGTLLGRDSRISDYSCRVINRLMEQGLQFTYATARAYPSSSKALKGLNPPILPVIVYNGAALCDGKSGKILAEVFLQQEEIASIRQFLSEREIYPLVYSRQGEKDSVRWLVGKENEGMRHYLQTRSGDPRLAGTSEEEELYGGRIFYVTCIGTREELLPVYEQFRSQYFYNCILQQELYREEYFCEIFPRKATKFEAVQWLRKWTGAERIIGFGDRINDLPLFEACDCCYAVSNAVEELKRIADGVIASNEEDGVARWLSEHAQELL